ncbi:hypothetical protein MTER_24330 [Mycolicibacter terrae]|jgi:hypothetical protein|uniref:Uncharacterized protein n=1 Tax=Mycolicibacter terrae TaxID=1788 RepID=A0AAD1MG15_9MYCO|nr:hypothetical protein [Mycolicibacter terrae]BBX23022.1 hypothetical protein MTER_24330 [Mycolicibacter terrae]SNV68875.1 Uncharacterised protein [Mycolicibacter terrae]
MARHHRYSKRSRESRKAMTDGFGDVSEDPGADDVAVEDWSTEADEPDSPPGPAG